MPAAIRKYLFPTETEGNIFNVRKHLIVVMAPIFLTVVGLAIAASVAETQPRWAGLAWIVWMPLFLWTIWRVAAWQLQYFVFTKHRIMLVEHVLNIEGVLLRGSVIKTRIETLPLKKVTDMRVHRTTLGYLFGYGDFIVESAGQEQAIGRVRFVPDPEQLRTEAALLQRAAVTAAHGRPAHANAGPDNRERGGPPPPQ